MYYLFTEQDEKDAYEALKAAEEINIIVDELDPSDDPRDHWGMF